MPVMRLSGSFLRACQTAANKSVRAARGKTMIDPSIFNDPANAVFLKQRAIICYFPFGLIARMDDLCARSSFVPRFCDRLGKCDRTVDGQPVGRALA